MSLLIRSEILKLFANALTANDKYPHCYRENFVQQFQMQLTKKPKAFFLNFIVFLKST